MIESSASRRVFDTQLTARCANTPSSATSRLLPPTVSARRTRAHFTAARESDRLPGAPRRRRSAGSLAPYISDLDPQAVLVELYADGVMGSAPVRQEMKRIRERASASGGSVYGAAVSASRPPADRPQLQLRTGEEQQKTIYERVKKTEKNAKANGPEVVRVRPGHGQGGRGNRSDYVRTPTA